MASEKRIIRFYVDRKTLREGGVSVIGRCIGATITIGDSFQSVYPTSAYTQLPEITKTVSLRVRTIDFRGRLLNYIDPPYTCELILDGLGAEEIKEKIDEIGGESDIPLPGELEVKRIEESPFRDSHG
jgi:hypothetical protein